MSPVSVSLTMAGGSRSEFWVHCRACRHEWVAAYLPMEVTTFAKVAKAQSTACPKCGTAKKGNICCGKAHAAEIGAPT